MSGKWWGRKGASHEGDFTWKPRTIPTCPLLPAWKEPRLNKMLTTGRPFVQLLNSGKNWFGTRSLVLDMAFPGHPQRGDLARTREAEKVIWT